MTSEQEAAIWEQRRERAKCWRTTDLKGYPTVSLDAETNESLHAIPALIEDRKKPRKEDSELGPA